MMFLLFVGITLCSLAATNAQEPSMYTYIANHVNLIVNDGQ